ncbi:MAG: hypothetical protein IMF01_06475 [Proteobacteria bacterium]|nr:hypothetical protein [Pseudomonadota bacterium]
MIMEEYESLKPLVCVVKQYSAFASLFAFHILTYPRITKGFGRYGDAGEPDTMLWGMLTVIALAAAGAMALWHRRLTGGETRPAYLKWGEGLLYGAIALIMFNLFSGGSRTATVAILFNILFFTATVWLVYVAMHSADRPLVNTAFFFFAITLLARYFDTFWTLMNRSFFFMTGGMLLLGGGYLIERQRRKITADIMSRQGAGGHDEA